MVNYHEALSLIHKAALATRLSIEKIGLLESVGRVCAVHIVSPEAVPPFANSSMDGFALRSILTINVNQENPLRFKVIGSLAAGDAPPLERHDMSGAWEIMTGAAFPEGYDASVKIEDVIVTRDAAGNAVEIEIKEPLKYRQNWRGPGEDFQIGSAVVAKGTVIMPEHVLALATLGVSEVQVYRRVKVGIISTGKELVSMCEKITLGQIRNSTAPYLLAALKNMGAEAVHLGTVGDEPEAFQALLKTALSSNRFDVLFTTGAVSVGKFDFVTSSVAQLGAEIYFHNTAIRPGKPLLFARFQNGPVLFGLPGNPVSGVVSLRFFFDSFLRAVQNQNPEMPIKAYLSEPIRKPEGLRCFFKSRITSGVSSQSTVQTTILHGQASFMVSPLLAANAWTVLSEEDRVISAGALVDVYPLYSQPYDWQPTVNRGLNANTYGGCC